MRLLCRYLTIKPLCCLSCEKRYCPPDSVYYYAAYVKCEKADHLARVPLFDQRIGLLLAFYSAMKSAVLILDEVIVEPILAYDWLPHDDDLRKAVIRTFERAQKYFNKEK